jgi:hypothetical protein
MFIIWGRKLVYRKLGHVADFCPICRVPRPFALKRVGSAGHVYYISTGEGELVGYERTCQDCGTSLQTEPTAYASIAKNTAPLAELTRQTYPNLDQVLGERLALEEKVRHAPSSLSREERHALIRSPFLILSPKVEKRFASTHIDKEIGFALIGAVALLIVGPALGRAVVPDSEGAVLLTSLSMGVLMVLWQGIGAGGRFMRREITPVLARCLAPLRPSDDELKTVLAELKQLRHKMGSKLKPADLHRSLRESTASQPLGTNGTNGAI